MFGIDDWIAGFSEGAPVAVVLLVAVLLGLRHATDPDHIAAMTTLVASGRDRPSLRRETRRLVGDRARDHAGALRRPDPPRRALRARAGAAGRRDRRRGADRLPRAAPARALASRLLRPPRAPSPRPRAPHQVRTPLGALGIGLVHGIGGSAGVGILLLATIPSETVAVASLLLLALFTAVSMAVVTVGFGLTLTSRPVRAARTRSSRCSEPRASPSASGTRLRPGASSHYPF